LAIEFYSGGYQRDRLRAEVEQNFPSNSNTSAPTSTSVPHTHKTPTTPRLPATKIPKVVDLTQPLAPTPLPVTHEVCYVCDNRHPPGCVLQAHPDTNLKPNIAWKDSPSGKAITKLKGPNASIDI